MTNILYQASALTHTVYLPVITPSLQSALTPWYLTRASDTDFCVRVREIEASALSPTFQFTRSLGVWIKDSAEEQRLLQSDLCAPLFSHLQELQIAYSSDDQFTLLHGEQVARFVLRFRLLNRVALHVDLSITPPSEVMAYFNVLFHSQVISQTLLVFAVRNFEWLFAKRDQLQHHHTQEYRRLIARLQIVPYLAQKMVELYRNDHGESLVVFVRALNQVFKLLDPADGRAFSIDEIVPAFDLLTTLTINRDLFHPCFYQSNPRRFLSQDPWVLCYNVVKLLDSFTSLSNDANFDFIKKYGPTLVLHLFDLVFEKSNGSWYSRESFWILVEIVAKVIGDDIWFGDDDDDSLSSGGLFYQKMKSKGRKVLEHVPFEKIASVLRNMRTQGCTLVAVDADSITSLMNKVISYCDRIPTEFAESVTNDVAPRIINSRLPNLLLSCLMGSLETSNLQDSGYELWDCIKRLVMPGSSSLLVEAIGDAFFRDDETIEQLTSFAGCVRERFETAISEFEPDDVSPDDESAEATRERCFEVESYFKDFQDFLYDVYKLILEADKHLEKRGHAIDSHLRSLTQYASMSLLSLSCMSTSFQCVTKRQFLKVQNDSE